MVLVVSSVEEGLASARTRSASHHALACLASSPRRARPAGAPSVQVAVGHPDLAIADVPNTNPKNISKVHHSRFGSLAVG